MKSTTHAGFWLTLAAVLLLAAPFFYSAAEIRTRLVSEIDALEGTFGTQLATRVVRAGNTLQDVAAASLPGRYASRSIAQSQASPSHGVPIGDLAQPFVDFGWAYVGAAIANIYCAFVRLCIAALWAVLLLPFLGMAIYDGIVERDIGLASFGVPNPTGSAIGSNAAIPLLAMPLIYITAPMAMPILTIPAWALCVAVPLRLAVSHSQPIFRR